ncbi:MAG: hypothetical protein ACYTDY_00180 [Planctomycetota bacterium]|jgi:hypothetical protein
MIRWAYFAGVGLQGLVLGILLVLGICELIAASSGVRLFRYQGF